MVAILQLGLVLIMCVCPVSSENDGKSIKPENGTFYLFYAPEKFTAADGLNVTFMLSGKITDDTIVTANLLDGNTTLATVSEVISNGNYMAYMTIKANAIDQKSYTLEGHGKGGVQFVNKFRVNLIPERSLIVVQTDKPVYKPGETVKLRVFSLDEKNLLLRNDPITVRVYDKNSNLIYNMSLTPNKGVYGGEFEISSHPPLGSWFLLANSQSGETKYTFKVDEYVLPKFEVNLIVDKLQYSLSDIRFFNQKIDIYVNARYTQGKPITGEVTLSVSCHKKKEFSKKIKGETHFQLSTNDFNRCYQYTFNASVKNELSGKVIYTDVQNAFIRQYPVYLTTEQQARFSPMVSSDFVMLLKRHDGLPLTNDDIKNPLNITAKTHDGTTKTMPVKIPRDGRITVTFVPPNSTSLYLNINYTGIYKSRKYVMKQQLYFSSFMPAYGRNIFLSRLNKQVKNPATFRLSSSEPMKKFTYSVISRAQVITSKEILLNPAKNTTTFTIDILPSMFPRAHVLVSYCRQDGQLLGEEVTVDVDRPTMEMIEANYSKPQVKPGEEAELNIFSLANATVFVTAVDKSVLLLEKPQDITYEKILKGLDSTKDNTARHMDTTGNFLNNGLKYSTNMDIRDFVFIFRADNDDQRREFSPGNKANGAGDVRVRTAFPETWIWDSVDIPSSGSKKLVKIAPDTITSWATTMFAVHPTQGLSILKDPLMIKTFNGFYISLELPYSITKGEIFNLIVYIFKYIEKDETVTVQLMNSQNSVTEEKEIKMSAKDTEKAVSFEMTPTTLGLIPVFVKAFCSSGNDAVKRNLRVKPAGNVHYMNQPVMVNVSQDKSFQKTIDIKYPAKVVEGSKRVTVSVIGDVMGPVLSGLETFIRLPTGCGEQTMISLYPNVLVYMYLKGRGHLNQPVKGKIVNFIRQGYQNELKFQHGNGAFSAFGTRDRSGSTWLTAYVMKCFCEAKHNVPNVMIDQLTIKIAKKFIIMQQLDSGEFREPGRIIHTDMQGGTSSGITMTTFVLISFLQCQNVKVIDASKSIELAQKYIRSKFNNGSMKDSYSLSLALTAFAMLKDDKYFGLVNKKLLDLAIKKDKMMYWPSSQSTSSSSPMLPGIKQRPRPGASRELATTSYVLLAYSYKRMVAEGLPILNFIQTQRNSLGGFGSTQDTVLGLEALARFSSLLLVKDNSAVNVIAEASGGTKHTFPSITQDNVMMLYEKELPSETSSVKLDVKGSGYALAQVSWQFNMIPEDQLEDLKITVTKDMKASNREIAVFDVCTKYTGKEPTGMVIVIVEILSGYLANLVPQGTHHLIMKSEIKDDELVVYLDSLKKDHQLCFPVTMDRIVEVMEMQPKTVRASLYYEPGDTVVVSYNAGGWMLHSTPLLLLIVLAVLKLLM